MPELYRHECPLQFNKNSTDVQHQKIILPPNPLPLLPFPQHCSVLHLSAWEITSKFCPLIQPVLLYELHSVVWKLRRSCSSNLRNSLNFTLCCLPEDPRPRLCDLVARVSFQHPPHLPSHSNTPHLPLAERCAPVASLLGSGSGR